VLSVKKKEAIRLAVSPVQPVLGKSTRLWALEAYMEYVSKAKIREHRWQTFVTSPYSKDIPKTCNLENLRVR
jgi:hypothetical protein